MCRYNVSLRRVVTTCRYNVSSQCVVITCRYDVSSPRVVITCRVVTMCRYNVSLPRVVTTCRYNVSSQCVVITCRYDVSSPRVVITARDRLCYMDSHQQTNSDRVWTRVFAVWTTRESFIISSEGSLRCATLPLADRLQKHWESPIGYID